MAIRISAMPVLYEIFQDQVIIWTMAMHLQAMPTPEWILCSWSVFDRVDSGHVRIHVLFNFLDGTIMFLILVNSYSSKESNHITIVTMMVMMIMMPLMVS